MLARERLPVGGSASLSGWRSARMRCARTGIQCAYSRSTAVDLLFYFCKKGHLPSRAARGMDAL